MEKMCWGIILACWLWGAARAVDNPAPKITATVEETAAPRATDAQVAQAQIRKNQLIGTILKTYLENYHFREMEINDQVSKKAFEQFIKKVDPGKQFLLESEYQRFAQKYRLAMDDLLLSGKGTIINEMLDLMHQRYQQLETFRAAAFKKPFDFKQQQFLELNPDKRKFATDMNQLKDYWFRMFKHSTLVRYFALVDEQQGQKENKNKNKNDKDKKDAEKVSSRLDEKANTSVEELLGEEMEASAAKKVENIANLSDRQLWAKAQEAIGKKYQRLYARLLKEDYEDYLEYFYNSITAIYDPHTVYMPPKRKEDFNIDISGSLEGIGAVLQEDESYIKVVKIIPGGAAWRQKELEVGDLIMAAQEADGELVDLVDMRVDDAVRYIRGKKGTQVRLTVKKVDGQVKVIPITRDVVEVGESYAKSSVINHKDSPYRIGYIYLPKFYRDFDEGTQRNCTDDILQKLKQFKEKDLDGVILDLRNNGGGSLKDAEQMTGLFIKEGPVVQVKERSGKAEVLADVDKNIAYEGPLIVLVNRFSASASEIVAGALQDYHRAVIVGGEFTHGKGTVQAVVGLNQGPILSLLGPVVGALKVTIQKFYRVTGASTQYNGITPDIILPDPLGYLKSRERDLDYSLPGDEISRLRFKKFTGPQYDLAKLKERAALRVAQDPAEQKIIKAVQFLAKRQDATKVSLNYKTLKQENDFNKKLAEELKQTLQNTNIQVTDYTDSIEVDKNWKEEEKANWEKDFTRRGEEWVEGIQKDSTIDQALYIMEDMINMANGNELPAIPTPAVKDKVKSQQGKTAAVGKAQAGPAITPGNTPRDPGKNKVSNQKPTKKSPKK